MGVTLNNKRLKKFFQSIQGRSVPDAFLSGSPIKIWVVGLVLPTERDFYLGLVRG